MADKLLKNQADVQIKKAYSMYYSNIYRFVLSRLKSDRDSVEDVVQDAFLVLYNKYLQGVEVEFVQAFLMKTADNLIKKKYLELEKQNNQVPIEDIIHIASQNEDIDDRLTFEQYSRQISDALNDKDAEIFSLRYIQEFKIDEIAERMEMTIPAVTTRLSRIRDKLKKLLNEGVIKIYS